MGDCKDTISNTCGKKINAKCVDYEGDLHKNTLIKKCAEPSVEDVIEDINTQLDVVSTSLDLSGLGKACITYTKTGEKLLASEAFLAMEAKICELSEYVGLPSADCQGCAPCSPIFKETIACMGLNLGDLADPCGETPTTIKDLLQAIINKLNE